MDASWVAPVATGLALMGYMELRSKQLGDAIADLTKMYIRHLELHAGNGH
jgi:hypothetical protein